MKAFLIGSHVYGEPRPDSDIDLVIRIDPKEAFKLGDLGGWSGGPLTPIRFGKLNIIYAISDEQYECWVKGLADILALGRKVTREEAKEIFESYRAIHNNGRSGPNCDDTFPVTPAPALAPTPVADDDDIPF